MALIDTIHGAIRQHLADHSFVGVVTSKSGNQIGIQRPGQAGADGQTYAAASGLAAAVSVNDRVLVQRAGSGWVVVCRVVS